MSDMNLPPDRVCRDCQFYGHCRQLFSCDGSNTTCDWSPSRFALRIEPVDTKTIDLFGEQAG